MANILSADIQYTTVRIVDDADAIRGTGFLIADTAQGVNDHGQTVLDWKLPQSRAYLITARHVLGKWASEIGDSIHYLLQYNAHGRDGFSMASTEFLVTRNPANWAVHPTQDVAALDVTDWTQSLPREAHIRFWPLSELANPVNLAQACADAGDDVFLLGYPLTLRQGQTSLPLVRRGVLASSPRRSMADSNGRPVRGFLIDGAVLNGSSGSPVVSTSQRFLAGDLSTNPSRPLLLGVVTEAWDRTTVARYDALRPAQNSCDKTSANLGLAMSAATIIETVEGLGHHARQDFLIRDHFELWAPQLQIPEGAIEFEGPFLDDDTTNRIMLRRWRDRLRARGIRVGFSHYHDAPDIMGPINDGLSS